MSMPKIPAVQPQATAPKQEAWLKIQRDKFLGVHIAKPSIFDKFIKG